LHDLHAFNGTPPRRARNYPSLSLLGTGYDKTHLASEVNERDLLDCRNWHDV